MVEWYINVLAGAAGGVFFGVIGYLKARKDGEALDLNRLINTSLLPFVLGAAAGAYANDPMTAYTAGLTLRGLQDLGTKYAGAGPT